MKPTRKYYYIRRAMFEANFRKEKNKLRSINEMIMLFKVSMWISLFVVIISLVALFYFFLFDRGSLLSLIPSFLIIVISSSSSILSDDFFYKTEVRNKEINDSLKAYDQHNIETIAILNSYGINTVVKLELLRSECEEYIKSIENKYLIFNRKVYELIIAAPLATISATIIHSGTMSIDKVVFIVGVGLFFLGLSFILKLFFYYLDGHYKNRILLDAINELKYLPEILEEK